MVRIPDLSFILNFHLIFSRLFPYLWPIKTILMIKHCIMYNSPWEKRNRDNGIHTYINAYLHALVHSVKINSPLGNVFDCFKREKQDSTTLKSM